MDFESLSNAVEAILAPPFLWCYVPGGNVTLVDARQDAGTPGGTYQVVDFAIARYPITNSQYERFLQDPGGFADNRWWEYSPEGKQWRRDRRRPLPTAFPGPNLPRTHISWFDGMAFCAWLTERLRNASHQGSLPQSTNLTVRLPTEQEWQRAAMGDTGWCYPWGNELDGSRANFANAIGRVSDVNYYPQGASIFGVLDMIGNVWEWCLTGWNQEVPDLKGYTYRVIKGGAWNITNPDHLRADGRGCHPPRGRLNDCGMRPLLDFGYTEEGTKWLLKR